MAENIIAYLRSKPIGIVVSDSISKMIVLNVMLNKIAYRLFNLTIISLILLNLAASQYIPGYFKLPDEITSSSQTGRSSIRLLSQVGGKFQAIAIQTPYIYVGAGHLFQVYDAGNLSQPIRVADGPILQEPIYQIVLADHYAYLANGKDGLTILDISNPFLPRVVSSIDTPGDTIAVNVIGRYAYLADRAGGLRIIDINTAYRPIEIGSYQTSDEAMDLVIANSVAYVAVAYHGLEIINVLKSDKPSLIGSYRTGGYSLGVDYNNGLVYLADQDKGLSILDVRVPQVPTELSRYLANPTGVHIASGYAFLLGNEALTILDASSPTNLIEAGFFHVKDVPEDISFSGPYAFVAAGGEGVIILDIQDPVGVYPIGAADTPGIAETVVIQGNYAYVADNASGLRLFDVSIPSNPVEISAFDTMGTALGVAVDGNFAYIADGVEGMQITEVKSSGMLVGIGSINTPGDAIDISTYQGYAYLADGTGGLRIVNIVNPSNPIEVSSVDTPGDARGIAHSGKYIYLADGWGGLRIIDISTPNSPYEIGGTLDVQDAKDVILDGTVAYVADGARGLSIVDVSNPTAPLLISRLDTPGYAQRVAISGKSIYVADHFGGLAIINVLDPYNPVMFGYYQLTGYLQGVAVIGQVAYLANAENGLKIFDVLDPVGVFEVGSVQDGLSSPWSLGLIENEQLGTKTIITTDWEKSILSVGVNDPEQPISLDNLPILTWAGDIAIQHNTVYLADGDRSLHVIDASNPKNLMEISSIMTSGVARGVEVNNQYGFVADGDAGLLVIDLNDPYHLKIIGSVDTPGSASGVALKDNLVFVSDGISGLHIFDVTQPSTPIHLSTINTPWKAEKVEVISNYAYIADGNSGVRVVDFSNPILPVEVGYIDTPGYAIDLMIEENYLIVADNLGGMLVLDIQTPKAPIKVFSYQNGGYLLDVAASGNFAYLANGEHGMQIVWFAPPVSANIPAVGGVLSSLLDKTEYVFPPYSFSTMVSVTHQAVYLPDVPSTYPLSGIGHFFQVSARDMAGQPVQASASYQVTITYTDSQLQAVNESTLALYYWDGTHWVKESSSSVDVLHNQITAKLDHFSLWGVLGDTHTWGYLPVITNKFRAHNIIAGRVVNLQNKPMPGVKVMANELTSYTDQNGNFLFTNLPTATYKIAPEKAGYDFSPAYRLVSFPPGDKDLIFQGILSPAECLQLVRNSDFEHIGEWNILPTEYPSGYITSDSHSGHMAMRTGILSRTIDIQGYSAFSQAVAIPSNASSVTLNYWIKPISDEAGVISQSLFPDINNSPNQSLSEDVQYVILLDEGGDWVETLNWQRKNQSSWSIHQFDLSKYLGKTIQLVFGTYNDGIGGVTAMLVDDVTLKVCP